MLSQLVCPHCGKTSKLIPVSSKREKKSTSQKEIFKSSAATFPDQPELEIIEQRSFWASDVANYGLTALFAGGVVFGFSRWYGIETIWTGVFIAGIMLVVGVGLPILKIFLHAPPRLPKPDKPTTIKIEQQSEDKQHWLLAELDFIHPAKFYRVITEVDKQGKWTRKVTTNSGLSQGQHIKLQDKFIELGYLSPKPDNAKGYKITFSGRLGFKEIAAFGGLTKIKPNSKKKGMSTHSTERWSGRANW